MIEVNSFAELRTTKPSASGEIAFLKRYYDKDSTFNGGGRFAGFIDTKGKAPADDNGTIAVSSAGDYYWQRIIDDVSTINIFHFGGKRLRGSASFDADNGTVNHDACINMYRWAKSFVSPIDDASKSPIRDIGIRFPAGKFIINPVDLTGEGELPFFNMYGDDCEYGVAPRTIITSDKSANTVFKVKARRTAIRGIFWDGQATADTTANTGAITSAMVSNQQPFFQNITIEGQYINVTCFRAENTGNSVFKFIDTLDTRLDQIYSKNTYSRVFDITWSDSTQGNWDHSTAVELTNSNFQYGYGEATLFMPRVGQGLIRNVWIEHTRFPGDLSNGQWIIDALSIESSVNPLKLNYSRVLMRQLSLQSGASIDTERTGSALLSSYEHGWRRDENYGTEMTGSMKAGWYSGHRVTNNSDTDKWFRVGSFNFRHANQHWHLEFNGKTLRDTATSPTVNPLLSNVCGKTLINFYRGSSSVGGNMHFEGDSGVSDCYLLSTNDGATCEAWVKLKAQSGDVVVNLITTGPTHFDEGQSSLFYPDFTEDTTLNLENKSRVALSTVMNYHNGAAGVGFDGKVVTLASEVTSAPAASATPAGYITVKINGVNRKLAYF
ncbi:exopolysaccharide biosynthesis protein CpsF [Duffyella gerundensis]|uniref:Exopolysaccharide biosynthesis protein CpsF n=1 Tax=Duffyella gerundensis TaxID=1619313 RepID=A0A0U5LQ05_9GAMM|nr:amylovoran biosynthesis protein AmsF [Duffyella gerundensis]CUU24460.1 exopolysaccharide biosynthesis protein CpsF [Duffyella gerundensis]